MGCCERRQRARGRDWGRVLTYSSRLRGTKSSWSLTGGASTVSRDNGPGTGRDVSLSEAVAVVIRLVN